jgi:hypothetical protein
LIEADLAEIEPERLGRYYTQAWAFTYFLWNRHPERVAGYLRALKADEPAGHAPTSLQLIAGGDYAAVEPDVKRFIDSL